MKDLFTKSRDQVTNCPDLLIKINEFIEPKLSQYLSGLRIQ